MDKERVHEYKTKLEKSIEEYMSMPISQRSAEAVESMCECLEHVKALDTCYAEVDHKEWMKDIVNADGTKGGHWTIAETNTLKPVKYTDECWNSAMNMIYSDYCNVFMRYGVGTAQFFADVTSAFLEDEDAPKDKLERYYNAMRG